MSKTILHSLTVLSSLTFAVAGCGAEPVDGADVEVVHGAICASSQLTPTAATSSANPKRAPGLAIDGSTTTRWESDYSDPQWLVLDLGALKTVNRVQIDWQTANASNYRIDVSSDNASWSTVVDKAAMPTGDHRLDDWSGFSVAARYVRMFGTRRNTQYGYSIWEMRVFGDGSATCGDGANLATAGWTSAGANFTPAPTFTISTTNKNAITMDFTGKTFTPQFQPPLLEFVQDVAFPTAGTSWRLTLTISGMNDQTNQPPRFMAQLGGVPSQVFSPGSSYVSSSFKLIKVATLTTGSTLTLDFTATIAAGSTFQLLIDEVPYFDASADGTTATSKTKLKITDAKLTRLQ